MDGCRCVDVALSLGSTHKLGAEDGISGGGWERSKSVPYAPSL